MLTQSQSVLICSFCNQSESDSRQLLSGGHGALAICQDCIKTAALHLGLITPETFLGEKISISRIDPSKIKAELDRVVVGQESAKILLSVAASQHCDRVIQFNETGQSWEKSNILMAGSTGTGKTLLMKSMADIIHVPMVICSATQLTASGYVGDNPESILWQLYEAAGRNIHTAQTGIIYLDEVDKLRANGSELDVGGIGVQKALLKIIEDADVWISPPGLAAGTTPIKMNTRNILFICGGAFVGLDEFSIEGLESFGMIPEFLGRLPMRIQLESLTIREMKEILVGTEHSLINQYKSAFDVGGINLVVDPDSIAAIAKEALNLGTGARGLRTILESKLAQPFYDHHSTGKTISIKDYF